MQSNVQERFRIFNTPKNLNLETLFPDFNGRDLPKIQFIIHQVNLFGSDGYEINNEHHSWTLSFSTTTLSKVLKTLRDHKIIYISDPHIIGVKSDTYKMVHPFNYLDEQESTKNIHRINEYLFLQRLKADNWKVVGKTKSKFIKPTKPRKPNKLKSTNTASHDADLIAENIRLKAEIKSLKAEITRLSSTSPETIVEPVIQPEHEPDSDLVIFPLPDDPDNDFISFKYRGTIGSIFNYSEMAYWFDSLPELTKHQVIIGIINGDYHINEHTVVDIEPEENTEGVYVFNYHGINTLMSA